MRTQMVKAIIDALQEIDVYDNQMHSSHITIQEIIQILQELTQEIDDKNKRIQELEANIIEADAQYNVDKKPGDIYSAELALVRMAAMGAEALYNQKETE